VIDLADYYSGGYCLIRANNPGWEQLKNGLLPEKLLSLSECICPRVAVHWGWTPGDREAALKFGIPETKLDEFVEWCSDAHGVDIYHASMFYSVDAARRFVARFLPDTDGLYLIGAGLYKPLEAAGWNLYPNQVKYQVKVDLQLQKGERKPEGVSDQIDQHLPLEAGGTPLGFEVICFFNSSDFADSWICNGIDEDMYELYGINPGQFGLIQTREEAQKTCEWIMEDVGDGNHRGEPLPYAYWLLVSYPLKVQAESEG
jgi:hypothetical protein